MAGNREGFGNKTIIRNNFIAGELNTQGDEYVLLNGNKFISATVRKNGKVSLGKKTGIKKRHFTKSIRKLLTR